MTKKYYVDDCKSSKGLFMRRLKNCVENEVNDNLEGYVDEDFEVVSLFGHFFLPSELLKSDVDVKNKIYIEYVDKYFNQALEELNQGLTVNFDGVDFKMKEEE